MNTEIWKPIPGYEGHYEASSGGRIRSLDRYVRGVSKAGTEHLRLRRGRVLRTAKHSNGYRTVGLAVEGTTVNFLVHRLIAATFLARGPGEDEVNHLDSDRTNNAAQNLEWCDHTRNVAHCIESGRFTTLRGSDRGTAKLDDDKVRIIRRRIAEGGTNVAIAREMGVSTAPISYIRNGKAWTHVR